MVAKVYQAIQGKFTCCRFMQAKSAADYSTIHVDEIRRTVRHEDFAADLWVKSAAEKSAMCVRAQCDTM